jgi:hypothetical protein
MDMRKVNWTELGRVTEPGRYGFRLGFVFITPEDLAIWQKYPDAAFTLIPLFSTGPKEEYRLGAFDLSSPGIG